jgi:hypothetical protein
MDLGSIPTTYLGGPVAAGLSWLAWRKREVLTRVAKSLIARLPSLVTARVGDLTKTGGRVTSRSTSTRRSSHQLGDDDSGATVMVSRASFGSITCVSGKMCGQRFEIPAEGLSIGRDTDSDVVVDDFRVSARHAHIALKGGQVVVVDDDSSNGVFLNESGTPIVGEAPLVRGDLLRLSATDAAHFIYRK